MKKRDMLLKIMAVSGELPAGLPGMVVGSDSYARSLITRLKKERYIAVRNKSGWKGYVLMVKGRQYLMEKYGDDVGYFLTGSIETNHVKSELDKRIRLHRMSMAWVFFYKMGIPVFRGSKRAVFDKGHGSVDQECMGNGPAYYGSLEFKGCWDKIKGSRACGIFLAGESNYVVYNTMGQRMKWAKKTERSMRSWLEGQGMHWGQQMRADAIILGSSMEFLPELLISDGGIRRDLFQVDDIYEKYFYVPIRSEAAVQMALLKRGGTRTALYQFLCEMLSTVEGRKFTVMNGYDKGGNPVYFCYELELRHLARVKQELSWRQTGKVICLDYQKAALTEYFGKGVEIQGILTEKVMQYFGGLDGFAKYGFHS